jgi:hypothetical protein
MGLPTLAILTPFKKAQDSRIQGVKDSSEEHGR